MSGDEAYFRGPIDHTFGVKATIVIVFVVVGLMVLANLALIWSILFRGGPDLGVFTFFAFISPFILLSLPFTIFGKQMRALRNGRILRTVSLEGKELVERQASVGKTQYLIEEQRLLLCETATAYVDGDAMIFKQAGSTDSPYVLVHTMDFVDLRAKEAFIRYAHSLNVEFKEGAPPTFGRSKKTSGVSRT